MSGVKGARSQRATTVPSRYGRKNWFRLLDGRSKVAKLLGGRRTTLMTSLGYPAALPYEDDSLCDRFLSVEAVVQKMELALANEDAVDLPLYLNALNTYVGLKKQVSVLRRLLRTQTPTDPLMIEHDGDPHGQ